MRKDVFTQCHCWIKANISFSKDTWTTFLPRTRNFISGTVPLLPVLDRHLFQAFLQSLSHTWPEQPRAGLKQQLCSSRSCLEKWSDSTLQFAIICKTSPAVNKMFHYSNTQIETGMAPFNYLFFELWSSLPFLLSAFWAGKKKCPHLQAWSLVLPLPRNRSLLILARRTSLREIRSKLLRGVKNVQSIEQLSWPAAFLEALQQKEWIRKIKLSVI